VNHLVHAVGYVATSRQLAVDDDWGGTTSTIHLSEGYPGEALSGLEALSHIEVLFLFHAVAEAEVVTGARHPRDREDWPRVGIFAQRAKSRPNRIGSMICPLVAVRDRTLHIRELDAIDGTPVLDIKPVMVEFLPREAVRQPPWATELMERYWRDPGRG
jgi:tRNA-Thr(GGU) m(6)t(6)A37 methyltransferase TsaA